jgi:serine/threonine protein kinase
MLHYLGRYMLVRPMVRGERCIVYEGLHSDLRTPIAIKIFDPDPVAPSFVVDRLLLEALAASSVHPSIIPVFDVGYSGSTAPYLVTELCQGATLADLLEEGTLPITSSIEIGLGLARILSASHAAGLIHGGLDLDQVFVLPGHATWSPAIRLGGYGTSRLVRSGMPTAGGTRLALKRRYTAPEAIWSSPTQSSDIYSLGALICWLLIGPPSASGIELLDDGPLSLELLTPLLPNQLARLLARMLSRESGARPVSMEEVASELEMIASDPWALEHYLDFTFVDECRPTQAQEDASDTARRARIYAC